MRSDGLFQFVLYLKRTELLDALRQLHPGVKEELLVEKIDGNALKGVEPDLEGIAPEFKKAFFDAPRKDRAVAAARAFLARDSVEFEKILLGTTEGEK